MLNMINKPAGSGIINNDLWLYVGCSESKERLRFESKNVCAYNPRRCFIVPDQSFGVFSRV